MTASSFAGKLSQCAHATCKSGIARANPPQRKHLPLDSGLGAVASFGAATLSSALEAMFFRTRHTSVGTVPKYFRSVSWPIQLLSPYCLLFDQPPPVRLLELGQKSLLKRLFPETADQPVSVHVVLRRPELAVVREPTKLGNVLISLPAAGRFSRTGTSEQ